VSCSVAQLQGEQEAYFHNRPIALLVLKTPLDTPCNQAIWHDIGGASSTGDQAAARALTANSHKTAAAHLKQSSRLPRSFSELEGGRGGELAHASFSMLRTVAPQVLLAGCCKVSFVGSLFPTMLCNRCVLQQKRHLASTQHLKKRKTKKTPFLGLFLAFLFLSC